MKYLNSFSNITRILIITTVALLSYGYLCRSFGIYFFWESKTIGWTLFWIVIIAILLDRIKDKKLQNKKTLPEKIGIGFTVFVIIVKSLLFFVMPQTSSYKSALNFINTNQSIRNEVGTVNGIFLIPLGSIAMTTNEQGSARQADLQFVVKGSKKYIDLNLLMIKDLNTNWEIEIYDR